MKNPLLAIIKVFVNHTEKIVFILVLLVTLGNSSCRSDTRVLNSQLSDNTNSDMPLVESMPKIVADETKFIRDDGWTLPNLRSDFDLTKRSQIKIEKINLGRSFYKKTPSSKDYIISFTKKDSLENWEVWEAIEFTYHSKPVCYFMKARLVRFDESGRLIGIAKATGINLFDNNNDGKFETLELSEVFPEIPSHLPDWLNKKN